MSRLKVKYQKEVVPKLKKELDNPNPHLIPKIEKVVLNVGFGKHEKDKRHKETVKRTLRKVSGQEPVETVSKKSIAGFKLREDVVIGMKVTLRGQIMYDFLDRFISVVLPRFRDFRGVSADSFDQQGNYSIGVNDQTVFPELSYEDAPITHGLQVNIITNVDDKEQNKKLLAGLGFPFERKG